MLRASAFCVDTTQVRKSHRGCGDAEEERLVRQFPLFFEL